MSMPIKILLVEDNPADAKLTKVAFRNIKIDNELEIVKDGTQAMAYLRRQGGYASAPRPDLILLDLNLPGTDGHQVLVEIKNDDELKSIPVIILTSSAEEFDVFQTYLHHANSYITKPVDLDGFMTIVQSIEDFWFTIVKLPRPSD